ncbi:hypothetical protein, partial [uncultured Fretibacterium sp.]|uniref:hypothetical protein n=1 Tax=uncultured Fretibacterium sp. TaxID=1678694 RepID=UPI0026342E1A
VPGAYAVVSSTSSIWIWNHDKWEDTGATQTQAGILDAPHDGKTYGRKDGGWVEAGGGTVNEEQVTNIIKNTQHNVLKSIQGGKVEGGQVTEAYHLTKEEWEKLPVRPSVISPANGETNINQVPQIVGTPYAHPYDVGMYQKHIQIATTNDFAAPIYEKVEFSGTPVFQVPLKPDNSPYLTQDTVYYVRIRYQDRKGRWSHWSAPSMFKTMVQFPAGILATPIMTAPQGEAPALSPVLGMSSPKVLAGTGNFDKGDWQVSTDSTFATTLYNAQGTNDLTFHTTAGLNLTTTLGVDFFARGRQRTTDGTYTPWAVPVRFGLRPEYSDPIFGLRRIFSKKYNRPFVYNIDPEGKIVNISRRYWDTHALYAFAKQSIVISPESPDVKSEMAFVPPCWEKCRVYDNDDGDMVIDLWFSATRQTGDGWFLDPAFTRSPNGFLHGTCLPIDPYVMVSGERKWVYCSTPGVDATHTDPTYIFNLRQLDSKWHYWSIYERRLLLDLLTAEKASLNTGGGAFGYGIGNTTTHSMSWRGFFGFFNVQNNDAMIVDGLEWSASSTEIIEIRLKTPEMNNLISIPWALPYDRTTKYPVDIERGDNPYLNIDLALLGLVKTVRISSSEDTTTPYGMSPKILVDAKTADSRYCTLVNEMGLFGLCPGYDESSYVTCRISKWLD